MDEVRVPREAAPRRSRLDRHRPKARRRGIFQRSRKLSLEEETRKSARSKGVAMAVTMSLWPRVMPTSTSVSAIVERFLWGEMERAKEGR
jgi:hypothetical protein